MKERKKTPERIGNLMREVQIMQDQMETQINGKQRVQDQLTTNDLIKIKELISQKKINKDQTKVVERLLMNLNSE